jgi:F-type H+-transporting ATPase subunit delta
MIVGSIARRYAKALFELAVEQRKVEAWSTSLSSLRQTIESSSELRDVLGNPIYTKEQRRGIVARLAEALAFETEPANLLYLLADRARLSEVGSIASEFAAMADAKLGRLRARVVSARRSCSASPTASQR